MLGPGALQALPRPYSGRACALLCSRCFLNASIAGRACAPMMPLYIPQLHKQATTRHAHFHQYAPLPCVCAPVPLLPVPCCWDLQAYDQHLNLVLGEVEETVTTVEIEEETEEELVTVRRLLPKLAYWHGAMGSACDCQARHLQATATES